MFRWTKPIGWYSHDLKPTVFTQIEFLLYFRIICMSLKYDFEFMGENDWEPTIVWDQLENFKLFFRKYKELIWVDLIVHVSFQTKYNKMLR